MKATNKTTGSPIVKAFERYSAATRIAPDSFDRMPDGSLTFEFSGDGAEVNWDLGEHARDNDDQPLYFDTDGELIPESQIELVGDGEDENDHPVNEAVAAFLDDDPVKRALQLASDALEGHVGDDTPAAPGSQLAAEREAHKAVNESLTLFQRA